MATKLWAIGLIVLMTLLTSVAQLLWKSGIAYFPEFLDWKIIAGLAVYGVGAAIFLFALKGGEVTVLYPIIATSYIWVAILSFMVFGESIGFLKIIGLAFIIIGISALGYGSQKAGKENGNSKNSSRKSKNKNRRKK